jgi:hypothetical protein
MATITWYGGQSSPVNLNGSGVGFYGSAGFGSSVSVGEWATRAFITNSGGSAMGPELNNCRYVTPTSVVLGQTGSVISLNKIPNAQATVNPRFEHTSAVKIQNAAIKFVSRSDITVPATGVTFACYEVVHPDPAQNANGSGGPGLVTVSGNHSWRLCAATGLVTIPLTASPGTSGLSPSGSNTTDVRHDFYLAISASPDQAGSLFSQAWLSLEYL